MGVARLVLAAFAAACVVCSGSSVWSDTWPPATVTTYMSSTGEVRFTVTPRVLRGPLAYFEDKVEGVEPPGQAPGRAPEARGKLERRGSGDQWEVVWDRPLVNDVSPVSALISDSGEFVVTFDNWHSAGWGDDAVVIYDDRGDPVRSMALTDFLPQTYVEALPRSVSSIQWSGEHRIEGGQLVMQVVVPDDSSHSDQSFLEIAADLRTGRVEPPQGEAWDHALRAAEDTNRRQAEAQARWRAARIAPLRAPTTGAERDWHAYLREAFYRLYDGDSEHPSASTTVLRQPTAVDYAPSLGWVRNALLQRNPDGNIMIGSPSEQNLAEVLISLGPEIPPGGLTGNTLYIAAGETWPAIREALAHSGADLRQLDPARPIPQRPDRMPQ